MRFWPAHKGLCLFIGNYYPCLSWLFSSNVNINVKDAPCVAMATHRLHSVLVYIAGRESAKNRWSIFCIATPFKLRFPSRMDGTHSIPMAHERAPFKYMGPRLGRM